MRHSPLPCPQKARVGCLEDWWAHLSFMSSAGEQRTGEYRNRTLGYAETLRDSRDVRVLPHCFL